MSFGRSDRDRLCSSFMASLPNRFVPTKATPIPRSCPPVDILNLPSSPPRYLSPLPAVRSGSMINLASHLEECTGSAKSNMLTQSSNLVKRVADLTNENDWYRKENKELRDIVELRQRRLPNDSVPRSSEKCQNESCIKERRELTEKLAAEKSKNEQKRDEVHVLARMNQKMDDMPQSCAERIHNHSDLQLIPEVHRCVSSGIPNSVQQISSELDHFTSTMAKIEEKIGDVNFAVRDEKGVTVEAMLHDISAQVQETQRTCSNLFEAVGEQGAIIELLRSISGEIQSRNLYAECKDKLIKETSKYVRLKRDFDLLKTEHAALQCRLPEENEILKQQNSDLWQQLKENEAHLQKLKMEHADLQRRLPEENEVLRLKDQKSKLEEECNKLKQQLESLKSSATRKQVMPAATRGGTPMKTNPPDIQREGHQALLLEYEDITTSIDGLLGELETHLGTYQAKQLMCQLFQTAFDKSKQLALQVARNQLGKLFEVRSPERECKETNLESTVHLYDKLICASLIKENATTEATYITVVISEVCGAFLGKDLYERVKDVLMPQGKVGKEFRELSSLAWKFATISPPLIVCQPEKFNETLIDREATHWSDSLPAFSLVFTRPVVYRSYHGMLGAQGHAGNAPIETGAKTKKK